jgi:hypothetical protein
LLLRYCLRCSGLLDVLWMRSMPTERSLSSTRLRWQSGNGWLRKASNVSGGAIPAMTWRTEFR